MKWQSVLVSALFVVPLTSGKDWQLLEYSGIPKTKVEFTAKGMKLLVNKSASPMVYPLPKVQTVKEIQFKATVNRALKIPKGKKQNSKKIDDYILRIGLVIPGDKTLNALQRMMAPSWLVKLFRMAPEGQGIDRVEFFNVVAQKELVGTSQIHPLSEVLHENFVWHFVGPGRMELSHRLMKPLKAAAVYIASDGDQTQSQFALTLSHLVLR